MIFSSHYSDCEMAQALKNTDVLTNFFRPVPKIVAKDVLLFASVDHAAKVARHCCISIGDKTEI